MTRLPMGFNGGVVGVTAPLNSWTAQDANQATYLSGSAKAPVVLKASPVQDAAVYTPAATLGTGVGDVEDGHPVLAADVSSCMDAAALSRRRKWATRGLTLFSNLRDVLMPVRDWLADLVSPKSLESALVLAGAQASDLSVPVASMMALAEETSGQPNVTSPKSDNGASSSQGYGEKKAPPQAKKYAEVPRWQRVLAMTAGRR